MNIRTRLARLEKTFPRPSCSDPWHVIAIVEVATEEEANSLPDPRQMCPTCREPNRGVRQIVVIMGEN